jgi:hypothetical protein
MAFSIYLSNIFLVGCSNSNILGVIYAAHISVSWKLLYVCIAIRLKSANRHPGDLRRVVVVAAILQVVVIMIDCRLALITSEQGRIVYIFYVARRCRNTRAIAFVDLRPHKYKTLRPSRCIAGHWVGSATCVVHTRQIIACIIHCAERTNFATQPVIGGFCHGRIPTVTQYFTRSHLLRIFII